MRVECGFVYYKYMHVEGNAFLTDGRIIVRRTLENHEQCTAATTSFAYMQITSGNDFWCCPPSWPPCRSTSLLFHTSECSSLRPWRHQYVAQHNSECKQKWNCAATAAYFQSVGNRFCVCKLQHWHLTALREIGRKGVTACTHARKLWRGRLGVCAERRE